MTAFIFVVYNDYAAFDALLKRQAEMPSGAVVVVVDNSDQALVEDGRIEEWRRRYQVRYLRHPSGNLGYSGAAQYAVEAIPELIDHAFICWSNVDLNYSFHDIDQFLTANYSAGESVGVIAPRLVSDEGQELPQLHLRARPLAKKYLRLATVYSSYPIAVGHRLAADLRRALRRSDNGSRMSREIFAPHGALMIFTAAYMRDTNRFDFPVFLFCEEAFVGIECERSGLSCVYEPGIVYSHRNHGAMGRIPSRRIVNYLGDAHRLAASALADSPLRLDSDGH